MPKAYLLLGLPLHLRRELRGRRRRNTVCLQCHSFDISLIEGWIPNVYFAALECFPLAYLGQVPRSSGASLVAITVCCPIFFPSPPQNRGRKWGIALGFLRSH
ncbi:hypothetical protein AA313_de0206735 [Arthrobotrys entomopaga]|nr:hypothetical protein AA313_de0206735 [Arthrobotrys entomopaga]